MRGWGSSSGLRAQQDQVFRSWSNSENRGAVSLSCAGSGAAGALPAPQLASVGCWCCSCTAPARWLRSWRDQRTYLILNERVLWGGDVCFTAVVCPVYQSAFLFYWKCCQGWCFNSL